MLIYRKHKKPALILTVFLLLFFIAGCRDKMYSEVTVSPESHASAISGNLKEGLKIGNCHYIDAKKYYTGSIYIAGEIYGEGMKGVATGVWIAEGMDLPENIFAVNQAAIAFSLFGPAREVKPHAGTNRKEVRILSSYIERKYYR